jgi:hypothetical protein
MRTMTGLYAIFAGTLDKQVCPPGVAVTPLRVLEGDFCDWPEIEQSTSDTADGMGS